MKFTTNKTRARNRKSTELPGGRTASKQAVKYNYYRSQDRGAGNQSIKDEERLSANANRRINKKALIVLFATLIIIILELPLTMPPKVIIKNFSGSDVPISTQAVYRNAIEHIFESAGILGHTKLTFDSSKLASQLERQYPETQLVSTSYSIFSWHPTITLELEPAMLALESSTGDYLIGASGVVVGQTTQIKSPGLPILDDQSGLKPKVGSSALPTSYMDFISNLIAQLSLNNIKPSKLVLPAASTELDLYPSGKGYFVKFNLRGQAREEAGTYLAAANYLAKQKITPANYIDARLPGRVYYK